LLALAALVFAALTPLLQGAVPPQPLPTQRVNLKVLVVGPSATQADFLAWQAVLQREGVPFDARTTDQLTSGLLSAGNTANYQAVIVTTGEPFAQLATLNLFEATFGILQLTVTGDTSNPAVSRGLNGVAGVFGDQSGQTGQLTATGLQAFPYLKGPIPMDPLSFGFSAVPDPNTFTSLVSGPGGGSYLGIYTDPIDLRQEMVFTVSSNQNQIENQLLRHGMLSWVTRGVYLGTQRNYFAMNIDDIFLPDAKWDPDTNSTPGDASVPTCVLAGAPVTCPEVRMIPPDTRDAIDWQNANGIKFDFLFNGQGVQDARDANGGNDPLADDPTNGLLANASVKSQFRWMNHTFTHAQLDLVSQATAVGEINNNIAFATNNGLPNFSAQEIVTGEHSGIGSYFGILAGRPDVNQNVVAAFNATGIRWVGDDNSAKPNQRALGNALTVPRYPSNVYYNVASRSDQLDEYNWNYIPDDPATPAQEGACVNTAAATCRATPATWPEFVTLESNIMFGHLMGNDPRPHYAHQSNLITHHFLAGTTTPDPAADGLGILYKRPGVPGDPGVLDALLAKYKTYFAANTPLVQPTQTESGQLLRKANVFAGLWPSGAVSGYLQDGRVHVVNNTGGQVEVPLTGTTSGEIYGGPQRSGWVTVNPGDSVIGPAGPMTTPPSGKATADITRLTLTNVTVSPRRFTARKIVKVKGKRRAIGGTTIRWRLNVPAKVQIVVQKKKGSRWVKVGAIQRDGKAGAGKYLFTGRIVNNRLIGPAFYRFVISASRTSPKLKTPAKAITFTFLKG
jgi:hypothetical protein